MQDSGPATGETASPATPAGGAAATPRAPERALAGAAENPPPAAAAAESVKLTIKGREQGQRPLFKSGSGAIGLPNGYSVTVEDPTYGMLTYNAESGLLGARSPVTRESYRHRLRAVVSCNGRPRGGARGDRAKFPQPRRNCRQKLH